MIKKELPPIISDMEEEVKSQGKTSLIPLEAANDWQKIINHLIDQLGEEELPDKVIKVAEYLICGWPLNEIKNRTGTDPRTIKAWIKKYPSLTLAIAAGQKELHKWRFARLEQQFLTALEVSQEVLDTEEGGYWEQDEDGEDDEYVSSTNTKLLALKATHARFILGLFAGQKFKLEIETPEQDKPLLKAEEEALDYIAQQISDRLDHAKSEPLEMTLRLIDADSGIMGPLVDEKGDPFHGDLGLLDKNDDGILCHICGNRAKALPLHVGGAHHMSVQDYELTFMLEQGAVRRG